MSVVFHGSGFTFGALQIDDIETAFLLFACYRLIPGIMIGSVAFGLASSAAMLFFYAVLRGFYSPRDAVYRGVVVATGYAIFAVFWALTLKAVSDLLDGRAMTYLRLSDLPSLSGVSTVYIFSTEAILFGFATGLVLLVLIFISKSHAPRTIFTAAPIAAMVIMYAMAAVHLAIGINKEFFATFESFSAHHGYQYLIYNLTLAVNVLLSDAIVLWRACAVWMNHRYIVWPSILIFGLTIVSNTVNLVWDYEVIRPAELANIDSNIEFGLTFSSTIRGWVSMGASLLANIFATCAVGYKCWMHRRSIRRHLSLHRKRLITEKILSIFVESGVVFIGFWVAFIAIAFFDPSRSYGPLIYVNSMIQLITIYPTIMIALVFVEKQLDADDVIVSSSKLSGVQPPHNRVALTVSTMICTVPPREELAMERCGDYDVESGRLYHGAWKNEASGSVLDDGTGSTSKTAAVDVEKDSEVAAHRLLQS